MCHVYKSELVRHERRGMRLSSAVDDDPLPDENSLLQH